MNLKILKINAPAPKPSTPKPQDEILKGWQYQSTKPLVSVACVTYNHQDFISDTLNSILSQKTSFP